jgi:streptogramin lyase
MRKSRRAYFRTHRSAKARRAYVKRQQARLRRLRRAAACTALPLGSRIVARVPIANDGPVVVASPDVWVIDRAGGAVSGGTPRGSIVRVDPNANAVTDQVKGVVGGQAAAGFGSIWIPAFAIDMVLRVDTTTREITRLRSGPSDDQGPVGVAITSSAVWVANHHGGTVAELDPATGAVRRSVELVPAGPGGPQNMVAEGNDLWVELAAHDAVARIDIETGTVVQRVSVPGGVCGGVALDDAHLWIASARCGSGRLSSIDRTTGRAAQVADVRRFGNWPNDVASALGSLWVTVDSPSRLLRLDPRTGNVVGSRDLPAESWNIAVGNGALWVRVEGALLRITPQD